MTVKKRLRTTIGINDLTASLGLRSVSDVFDVAHVDPHIFNAAYDEALKNDCSEEEAECIAKIAEDNEIFSAETKYIDAIQLVAQELYGHHKIRISIPIKMMGRGRDRRGVRILDKIKIEPTETWSDAARELMKTINGVGNFHFWSLHDFLDSGPYTPREAVMSHLHWIKRYPDVYGTQNASAMIEYMMR